MPSLTDDPLWFKDAVIYQMHVRAFCDGNGDGIGDFRGVIQKLDYLQQLGVTALWLLPFYPSPLRDDGYDTADYYGVHPNYGTLDDFKEFLAEAHKRGLRVITEVVINHTSDQHPWFQRARLSPPGSTMRDFYVWSDTADRYSDARIIFKDFELSNWTWDPVANAYYWHRFYSHQPDLNFDNPEVQKAVFGVVDFWLALGVDGLRLDAIPYLFEREGTSCENLPETHQFLRDLRAHVDANFQNKMLLAEANQWPEDAAAYFGKGDECHMAFHFPVMPRLFMALQMEDRLPIVDILEQTPAIPANCQWAMFLRNHDELTLEMVTDEERDYMYRMYATDQRARINLGIRRRLAPLLGNSRRKIELMNMLLLSLNGTPIIYYGDEIGMGDNIYLGDRNGVRTPMQWSSDRNAGFSGTRQQQQLFLPVIIDSEYHYEAVNVETQEINVTSLLWWTRRTIAIRRRYKAFSQGTIEFLLPDNGKLLAFVREFEGEKVLVVANLSRFTEAVELDLSRWPGFTPVEAFSQNRFPTIKDQPYFLTLGPHNCYWLSLEPETAATQSGVEYIAPSVEMEPSWEPVLAGMASSAFEESFLPLYLKSCRWFRGKAHILRSARMVGSVLLTAAGKEAGRLAFVQANYVDIPPEIYLLPLQIATAEEGKLMLADAGQPAIARLHHEGSEHLLFDAVYDESFRAALLEIIAGKKIVPIVNSRITGIASELLEEDRVAKGEIALPSKVLKTEQSNSSIIYGDKYFLKLYRKLDEGVNPDEELIRYLSEHEKFEHVPTFCGAIEIERAGMQQRALGLLVALVPNVGDAWAYTLDALGRYFERVLAQKPDAAVANDPAALDELIGGVYPERMRLLAQRTGEMHLALAAKTYAADFAPEPFTGLSQRSLYQSMRSNTKRMTQFLKQKLAAVPEKYRQEAAEMIKLEGGNPAPPGEGDARQAHCHQDPHPRGLPPGPGLEHRQGFRDHRFRGRARAPAQRTEDETTAVARCRRDSSLVPLRDSQFALPATSLARRGCGISQTVGGNLGALGARGFPGDLF
jgi:maltose alpha-D-glucosyltransferase/alpha-amylase